MYYLGCSGYHSKEGSRILISIGGSRDIASEYDIDKNIWTDIKPLPRYFRSPRVLLQDNFIYLFGGSSYSEQIYRINFDKRASDEWAYFSNMECGSIYPVVIFYEFDVIMKQ